MDGKEFIDKYRSYLDHYMKICLANLPRKSMPVLQLTNDEGSWTNKQIIHIGMADCPFYEESDMMRWVLCRTGHEVQHVRSTTQKAWEYGLTAGYHAVCESISAAMESKRRLFRKEEDYDRFFKEMKENGYNLSQQAIKKFVHFIANSLEDGRIERIRCIKRPNFRNYVVFCRGYDWENEPVPEEFKEDLGNPRIYLSVILNQVLTLSTMQIYQKGFVDICGADKHIHVVIQKLIPHIRKGVSSNTCRNCMSEAIEICKILALEIAEACRKTPEEELLEDILNELLSKIIEDQSFSADSRTEETGEDTNSEDSSEGSITISLFGISDLQTEEEKEDINGTGRDRKDQKNEKDGKDSQGDDDGKENYSEKPSSDSEKDKSSGSSGSSEHSDSSKSSDEKKQKNTSNDEKAQDTVNPSSISDKITEMIEQAEIESEGEVETAIEAGNVDKRITPPSKMVNEMPDDIDFSDVDQAYNYADKMVFEEMVRDYQPTDLLPRDLQTEANSMKKKIEKILKNRSTPSVRGMKNGRLDKSFIYKLPMGQMDIFSKKGKPSECDASLFVLKDDSGSMGQEEGSKRYYSCRSLAVIEHAFSMIPMKIVAFDALGIYKVRHKIIKNWNEKVPRNGSYNFFTHTRTGNGNKDGYSIRIATKELLLRSEKTKMLFILSDGLPSDYPGGYSEGAKDVKAAVDAARKAGIFVFSIYFGEESEIRESNADVKVFREMYDDKHCIVTTPDKITSELERMLKRMIFR